MLEQVLLKVPSREIVQRCRDKLLDQYMSENELTDWTAALKAYCSSQPPRDWHLSMQDIANIRQNADRSTWRFHTDPQTSVKMWVAQNPEAVLYIDVQVPIPGTPDYEFMQRAQPSVGAKGSSGGLSKQATSLHGSGDNQETGGQNETEPDAAEDLAFSAADDNLDRPDLMKMERTADAALLQDTLADGEGGTFQFNPLNWEPFSIAILTPEMVEAAVKWGHGGALQLDSTFGCNAQKFPLFTLLAVDAHGRGVPVAHCICSQEREALIQKFLEAVAQKVQPPRINLIPLICQPSTS